MSNRPNTAKNRPATRGSVAAARGSGGSSKLPWIIGGVVIVIAAALLVAVLAQTSKKDPIPPEADARAIVKRATTVPASVADRVGAGGAAGAGKSIKAVQGDPLTKDGKPEVLYIGAEYCPYCAAERWAVVNALARFGTFSDLSLSRSSSSDVFPNTPTLSFHGSRYTSKYVSFTGVETASNERNSQGGYQTLDPLTSKQQQLLKANTEGSIPFLDIAGRYVSSGATYSPDVLQGMSFAEIADALHDPESDVAKGAVGSGNVLSALICESTGGQPEKVCNSAGVRAAQAAVPPAS